MSIKQLIKDPSVASHLRAMVHRPALPASASLLAPPIALASSSLIGTAFDYCARWAVKRQNPHAIERQWYAEEVVKGLEITQPTLARRAAKMCAAAKKAEKAYIKAGKWADSILRAALVLATIDPIGRRDAGHDVIGVVSDDEVRDLCQLVEITDWSVFATKGLCLLNPEFGLMSTLVGGADADLVIDQQIIDVKTTKKLALVPADVDQVLAYFLLHHVASVGDLEPSPPITSVALYFARFAFLYVIELSALAGTQELVTHVEWFKDVILRQRADD